MGAISVIILLAVSFWVGYAYGKEKAWKTIQDKKNHPQSKSNNLVKKRFRKNEKMGTVIEFHKKRRKK